MQSARGANSPADIAADGETSSSSGEGHRSWITEHPRERLLTQGAATLADSELLAVVLGTGTPGHPARAIGESLLALGPGLKELSRREPRELIAVRGVGPARAAQLAASLELGRRAQLSGERRPRLRTPAEIYQYLALAFRSLRKEVFHVLSFNARNVLLNDSRVAEGSMNACPVDPREVFSAALGARATAIVLAHNHPSGDPEPSEVDIALTEQLAEGGRILGIRVLDHIVVGDGAFVSLLERGRLGSRPVGAGAWAARRWR
jgi:DNA repair protein RadC